MKVVIEVQKYEDDKNENKVKKIQKIEEKWCRFRLRFCWKGNGKFFVNRREDEEDERVKNFSKFVYDWKFWVVGVVKRGFK